MTTGGYQPDTARTLASDQANRSIWHNSQVSKSDPYVGELLIEHIRTGKAELEGAHLVGISLPGARLRAVALSGADLRDVQMHGADLQGADLSYSNLKRANLQHADLKDCNLEGADLTQCHLGHANLQHANLRNTLIDDTVLKGADLRNADLEGAQIVAFSWNRLTRFGGITGFETPGQAGDEDATALFAAPLALGEIDISASSREAVSGSDPDIEATRIYRSSTTSMPAGVLEPSSASQVKPTDAVERNDGESRPTELAVAAQSLGERRLSWLVIAWIGVIIGMVGTGLGIWGMLNQQVVIEERVVHVTRAQDSDPGASALSDDTRALRRTVTKLTAENRTLTGVNRTMQAQLIELRTDRQALQLEAGRLATRNDQLFEIEEHHQAAIRQLANERERANRLEQTAAMLAQGVGQLKTENHKLNDAVDAQVRDATRMEELTSQVDVLTTEKKNHTTTIERQNAALSDLRDQLDRSNKRISAFLRLISGTALEGLIETSTADSPLVAIEPGATVTFGGDNLLTLKVDRSERPGHLDVELVLQSDPGQPTPELSLILYGEGGLPIRKLSASFPVADLQSGFASLFLTVSSQQFPTSARVLLTPGLTTEVQQVTSR